MYQESVRPSCKKKKLCTSSVVFTPKSSREGEASALRVVRCAKRSKKTPIKRKKRRRVSKPRAHHQTRLTGAVTPPFQSRLHLFFVCFFAHTTLAAFVSNGCVKLSFYIIQILIMIQIKFHFCVLLFRLRACGKQIKQINYGFYNHVY